MARAARRRGLRTGGLRRGADRGGACSLTDVVAVEEPLRERGVEYLQVKTLGPSRPSEHYAATRSFYAAGGFHPLEELTAIWGEENPCLIMVKHLRP